MSKTPPLDADANADADQATAARWLIVAGLVGAIGVALGAFGAHGLRGRVDAEQLEWWQTAARYQQIHALALLVVAWAPGPWTRTRRFVAFAFTAGIGVFSATLYAMALGGPRVLGAVTPLGGLALILAYLGVAKLAVDRLKNTSPGSKHSAD